MVFRQPKPGEVSKVVGNYDCSSTKAKFRRVKVRRAKKKTNPLLVVEFATNSSNNFNRMDIVGIKEFLKQFRCKKIS